LAFFDLLTLHSNYGRIFSHFGDIRHQRMARPWNLGLGLFKIVENDAVQQTTLYWSAIVTVALSRTVFELFDVKKPWNLG